uniref:Single-stranded DNA binding protein n=1 Tax=Dicranema revolutum TaxID=239144 RepID=A0A4D6WR68_9FLOR|nr:hypothetical protein [Dicranema revolutum]
MNICIFTARVVHEPRLFQKKKQLIAMLNLCMYNYKKNTHKYYINTKAKHKVSKQIFNSCQKGSFIIIEGSIKCKLSKFYHSNKYSNVKRIFHIKLNKIYIMNSMIKY